MNHRSSSFRFSNALRDLRKCGVAAVRIAAVSGSAADADIDPGRRRIGWRPGGCDASCGKRSRVTSRLPEGVGYAIPNEPHVSFRGLKSARHGRVRRRARHSGATGTQPHGQRQGGALQPGSRRARAAAVAGKSGAAARRDQPRQVFLRGHRPAPTGLYSRGFSSIYGEWETTAEARDVNRTFSESLRFPLPDRPVRIVVKKRDARERVSRDLEHERRPGGQVCRPRRGRRRRTDRQAARERRSRQEDSIC